MSVLDDIVTERARFGARISSADAVALLNAVAWKNRHTWGVFAAPPGGNGATHPNGFIRTDILANKREGRIFDVFIDGPDAAHGYDGLATPAFQDKGILEVGRFVEPVHPSAIMPNLDEAFVPAPAAPPAPVPGAPPAEEPHPLGELLEAVVELVGAVAGLADAVRAHDARLEQIQKTGVPVRWR